MFQTCGPCLRGDHPGCSPGSMCCCIEDHDDDDRIIRNFKRLKRMTPEAREVAVRQALQRIRERDA
jgi:hypothetical protein